MANNEILRRYSTLDAMRGLAAICVFTYHYLSFRDIKTSLHSYLAVDFFFALSGFVIAGRYGEKLRTGTTTTRRFAWIRLARLLPLVWLGAAIGFVDYIANAVGALLDLPTLAALNLMALPHLTGHGALFPLNAPLWSVSCELLVNGVYALGLCRVRAKWLWIVTSIAGAVVIASICKTGTLDRGWGHGQWVFGFIRTVFGFLLGVCFHGVVKGTGRPTRWALMPLLGLPVLFLLPVPSNLAMAYDIVALAVVLPALLWFGIKLEIPEPLRTASGFMGDISYPLYAIHAPLLGLTLPHLSPVLPRVEGLPWAIGAIIAVALATERYFDKPLRKRLSRKGHVPLSAPPQIVA